MFRKYEFRVIMFAPTASPVVQRQRTWHIGPTTCVFTSRRRAYRESSGSSADSRNVRIAGTSPSSHRASVSASPADLHTKQDALVILSAITYVRKPPDSAAAFAPRCTDAVSPPSVCASATGTSSSERPVSTTSPSSESSYVPSETASCATETGSTATPVTDSAAPVHGERSSDVASPSRPSASCRARIDAGSFLRGSRAIAARRYRAAVGAIIDGKAIAARVREQVADDVRELGHVGLATVLVGDDPASDIYSRRKHEAAQEVGMRSIDHRLPADTPQEELERLVGELNADDGVD